MVVIQRCDVTAASSAESGPNSSMRARRVILVDEFDAISDAECHDSFRCACVHHDCVRSTAQLGHCRIHTDQDGVLGVAHQDDRNFFLNPGWHSVNKWCKCFSLIHSDRSLPFFVCFVISIAMGHSKALPRLACHSKLLAASARIYLDYGTYSLWPTASNRFSSL